MLHLSILKDVEIQRPFFRVKSNSDYVIEFDHGMLKKALKVLPNTLTFKMADLKLKVLLLFFLNTLKSL